MLNDLRLVFRTVLAQKGFALATLTTLALGIGATTAMFSITYGVLLRPLPYADSDRLVRLSEVHPGATSVVADAWLSNLTYHAWNGQGRTIGPIASYGSVVFTIGLEEPTRIAGGLLSPEVFDVLRAAPARGRFFTGEDTRDGATPVVVLSDGFWRERFAGDPSVISQTLVIDQRPHVIVGIARPDFAFPDREARLWRATWVPLPVAGTANPRIFGTRAIARLLPGVSPAQAAAEGTTIARAQRRPPGADVLWGKGGPVVVQARTLVDDMTSTVRAALTLFLVGVGLLLLIACANVANLFLSRGVSRERELAIRTALGAAPARLIRQLLTETVVMAMFGGVLAVALALIVVRILPAMAPPDFPRLDAVRLDWTVLAFASAVSLAVGLLSGLLPAVRGARPDLRAALRDGAGASTGRRAARLRRALLAAEASLAVMLLVAALLVGRSFLRLLDVDPGYDAARVLAARVYLPGAVRGQAQTDAFVASLLQRLRAVSGVEAAGAGSMAPFSRSTAAIALTITASGRGPVTARSLVNIVTPGYAEALGLQLRAGRLLQDADAASGMQSLVVNEEFVRTFLTGVEPIGFNVGAILAEGVQAQVVGVVKNVLKDGLDVQPHPEVYVPPAHRYSIRREVYLLARTSGDPIALGGTLRQLVRDLRADAALENVMPLTSQVAASVAGERFATAALGSFASLAMILAAVGLYGVLSYGVTRRERELAVRRALGASGGRIAWLVIGDGMSTVAAGLIVGLIAAAGAARVMRSVLFGIDPLDIQSFALACGVLAAAALVACAVPARRAAATDPAVALRCQ